MRNEEKQLSEDIWITGSWIAYILPSFDLPAAIAVIHEKKCVRGAFTLLEYPSQVEKEPLFISTAFPSDWEDPVKQTLQSINIFDQAGSMSLDGISYILQVDTLAGSTKIDFSNPKTLSFSALEASLFHAAQEIIRFSGDQRQFKIIKNWENHLNK